MRCKNHYSDLSSTVGVCASCLRQRLFSLAVAQEHSQSQPQTQTLEDKIHRKTDNSASDFNNQHISDFNRHRNLPNRRKTDDSASEFIKQHTSNINRHRNLPNRRFFSSPQVAPVTGSHNQRRKKNHSLLRFSLLSKLFRSGKRSSDSVPDPDPDPRVSVSVSVSDYQVSYAGNDTATSATSTVPRQRYCSDRGMSPVRSSDYGGAEDEFCDGYELRKQTPVRRGGGGNGRSVAGLGFCLSPMVRVSPCRRWNDDGGEIGRPVTVKGSLLNAKGFCANRSRKVADFGRLDLNR